MYRDSEQALESIFVSYNKILKRIKLLSVTTKYGKEITHKDLRKAIEVMLKKQKFQIDFKMRKFQGVSSPYDQTTSPIATKLEIL